ELATATAANNFFIVIVISSLSWTRGGETRLAEKRTGSDLRLPQTHRLPARSRTIKGRGLTLRLCCVRNPQKKFSSRQPTDDNGRAPVDWKPGFLSAIEAGLRLTPSERPQTIEEFSQRLMETEEVSSSFLERFFQRGKNQEIDHRNCGTPSRARCSA